MLKVTLVGKGAVSKHLERVFSNTNSVEVTEVLSSRGDALLKALQNSRRRNSEVSKIVQPDIYIIAVRDDVITTVSKQLAKCSQLIVHTSGSVSIDAIAEGSRRGVFYPLQTFSKGRKVDFERIPICIEAEKKGDLDLLNTLATSVSKSVYEISSEQRKSLHLAAVFVNNFTNHLFQIGNEICESSDLPFDILKPLISETVEKISALPPIDAQTGPAKRNDQKTIERHLKQLHNKTYQKVYQILTESIKETYGEEL